MIALVPALAGALIVAGVIGVIAGLRPAPVPERRPRSRRVRRLQSLDRTTRRLLLGGLGAGVVAWLVTGWALMALAGIPQ